MKYSFSGRSKSGSDTADEYTLQASETMNDANASKFMVVVAWEESDDFGLFDSDKLIHLQNSDSHLPTSDVTSMPCTVSKNEKNCFCVRPRSSPWAQNLKIGPKSFRSLRRRTKSLNSP